MTRTTLTLLLFAFAIEPCLAGDAGARGVSEPIDFQKQIRPILSAKCFQCHGPDENTREAGLRLDQDEAAYEDLGGYAAVVPGNADESELIRRVLSTDEYEQMPPPDSGKELSREEMKLLKRWINEGAGYEEHWAFEAPIRPVPPEVTDSDWPKNAIDRFVLKRLEEEGLSPSEPVDRYRLVRRVYLDLIGLPPTVVEAEAFVNDSSPDAYERLVDRLLASPHYGERWARSWLDLARYSDTKGYEKDQPRTMWRYRDWVINALNEDKPFDEFTIEQIAGDMLPDATLDQRIATGFHRNTMTNEEGGIDPQEFRYHSIVDRVGTTGTTWLGLTLACAQCHTHKFDPITHTEYFAIFALLNNADELKIPVPDPETERLQEKRQAAIDALISDLETHFAAGDGLSNQNSIEQSYQAWRAEQRDLAASWETLQPSLVESNLATTDVLPDGSVLCSGDTTKNDTFVVTFDAVEGPLTAIRLEALTHPDLPGGGPGRQTITEGGGREGNFFLSEVVAWVEPLDATESDEPAPLEWSSGSVTFTPPGLAQDLAIDGKHDTGWTIHRREGEPHTAVFCFAEPVPIPPGYVLKVRLQHENYYPAGLGRFRLSATSKKGPVTASTFSDTLQELLLSDDPEPSAAQQRELLTAFLLTTPELREQQQQIAKLKRSMPKYSTALIMKERRPEHLRETHRRNRGEYLQQKELVESGVLGVLHDAPAKEQLTRLDFARWLVDRENPLVARVVVNRAWESFFGRGLVRTSEDFGYQSEFPTHPELLDWLAVEFMDGGWSFKQMHRLIVTSATYRQAASVSSESLARDPENKLLARGPRFRVDAEMVRDVVLHASGQLSPKLGGPSVFPPQPPGITEAAYGALQWKVSTGQDRYRRALYTFNKRTAPYASFGLFDAPSGEVCVPRRTRSNTPLQSLAMLNDEVVVEAARHMAHECLSTIGPDPAAIATVMFQRCVTRPPTDDELQTLVAYYQQQLDRLRTGKAQANWVLNSGPSKRWRFAGDEGGWTGRNYTSLKTMDGRLQVTSTGEDPFIGIDIDSPPGPYRLKIRARFPANGSGEVYWTTDEHPQESAARRQTFVVAANRWQTHTVTLKLTSPLRSLRIDTGHGKGVTEIESIELLNGDGLFNIPEDVDPNELAAWMLTARVVLNLDETITKP